MNQLVRKNQKSGPKAGKGRVAILIVHLDDGTGRPLCGLPRPWPTEAHRLAEDAPEKDACLTCRAERIHRKSVNGTLTLLRGVQVA